MTNKNLLILLVAMFALVVSMYSVSAIDFGDIIGVEVNGVNVFNGQPFNLEQVAGQRIPVLITFRADADAEMVRMKAWISGESTAKTDLFRAIGGTVYSRIVYLDVPNDLDSESESRKLEIEVESETEGIADHRTFSFRLQRKAFNLEILSIQMQSEIKAGESLVIDAVLKNRGTYETDDTFLTVRIPELGLETRTYYEDLSATDQGGNKPDKRDSVERRTFLRIPANIRPGLYTVLFEAFNGDTSVLTERRVLIVGSGNDASVFASSTSKTFSAGSQGEFKLTIVNRGNSVGVYTIVANAPTGLNVEVSEPVVVVPAGVSKTISVFASSSTAGSHTFTANVRSEDGTTLSTQTFSAVVEESKARDSVAQNTTLLLTVILAIVFVVLLVVLIVLLARKPEKTEESGESYY